MIIPLNIGLIMQLLCNFLNLGFAGIYLGKQALAAISLVQSLGYMVLTSFLIGFSAANDTLGSQAYGAQNFQRCAIYFNQTRISTILISILFFPIYYYCGYLLQYIGIDQIVSMLSIDYARLYYFANIMYTQGSLAVNFLRAQQHIFPTFLGNFLQLLVHATGLYLSLNYTQLGIQGIALVNCISTFIFLVNGYSFLLCGKRIHQSTYRYIKLKDFRNCKAFFAIAIPQCLLEAIEGWSFELSTIIIGRLGNTPLAAQGIIAQIGGMLWICSAFGISNVCTTFIGNAMGMGKVKLSKKLAIEIFIIAIAIISFQILVAICYPHEIISLCISDQQVIKESKKAFVPMLFGLILDTTNWMAYGILKGIGKVSWIPIILFVNYYLIHQPISIYFIFYLGYGYQIYWIILIIVFFLISSTSFILVFTYNWEKVSEQIQRREEGSQLILESEHRVDNNNLQKPLLNK